MTENVNDMSAYPEIPGELLRNACVLPHRLAALPLWPKDAVIAEIGVAMGGFSDPILKTCRPRKFIAIDLFDLHELDELWGEPTAKILGGRTHLQFYQERFAAEIADGLVEVIQGDSAAAIASLPDDSVDVFYVDAGHTYDFVRRDLDALRPKVKADGWVIMNDYVPADTFSNVRLGVIQATNEFMTAYGWEMAYLALAPVMYCDVGLRRAGSFERDAGGAGPSWSPSGRLYEAVKSRGDDLEAALAETHRSTSWRVTAPLRAFSRLVLRRK